MVLKSYACKKEVQWLFEIESTYTDGRNRIELIEKEFENSDVSRSRYSLFVLCSEKEIQ